MNRFQFTVSVLGLRLDTKIGTWWKFGGSNVDLSEDVVDLRKTSSYIRDGQGGGEVTKRPETDLFISLLEGNR